MTELQYNNHSIQLLTALDVLENLTCEEIDVFYSSILKKIIQRFDPNLNTSDKSIGLNDYLSMMKIKTLMEYARGNKTQAAKISKCARRTIISRVNQYLGGAEIKYSFMSNHNHKELEAAGE